jgi:hypothetical protein
MAESKAMKQLADVIGMVPHLENPLHQFRDPHRGPQIGGITLRHGTLEQKDGETLSLSGFQLGGTAWGEGNAKGLLSPSSARVTPS